MASLDYQDPAHGALLMACDLLLVSREDVLLRFESYEKSRTGYVFTIENDGFSTKWTVDIDYDADATENGWRDLSKCVRVEVLRG